LELASASTQRRLGRETLGRAQGIWNSSAVFADRKGWTPGRSVGSQGKVWIVNFIYTNCPDTCPIQSAQLRQIQEDFKNDKDLRLVSITVDPERDTREILSEYANRFGADPERWFFLTGEKEPVHQFAQEGFQLGAAEIPHDKRPASGATHTHSPRFVLVDREAQIRGYYVSTDPGAMKRLRHDLKTLLRGAD
jgi:protein SCO1/2